MTINELKFIIQRYAPKQVFNTIAKIWRGILSPVLQATLYRLRLIRFTKTQDVWFRHAGIKFMIRIHPSNGTIDKEIYLHGVYEPHFLSLIKKLLKPGDVFVDIGANIGQHSLFASNIVSDTGKVIAFEPIERLYQQFKESITLNEIHNIDVYNYGCSNIQETRNISTPTNNAGASSVIKSYAGGTDTKIRLRTADSVLAQESRIDLIKIDVEGYEYFALEGLRETLSRFRPMLLIEYSPYYYGLLSDKDTGGKIITLLLTYGYEIIDLENNDELVDLAYIKQLGVPQTNLLATLKNPSKKNEHIFNEYQDAQTS